MAGKRSLGVGGAGGPVQYPNLPKRPKIEHQAQDRVFDGEDPTAPSSSSSDQEDRPCDDSESNDAPAVQLPTKWHLSPEDIPAGAKKIYCVRRGHQPGFYFEYAGPHGAEVQVRGFPGNLFMSFPQGKKAAINPNALRDAVDYMNHDPQTCKYTCSGQCGDVTTFLQQPQSVKKAATRKDPSLCRDCQQQSPRELPGDRWQICHSCWISTKTQSAIYRSSQKFQLTEEQIKILELVAKGRNVFFTGAAGTGKSTVLQAVVDLLKSQVVRCRVVAPTGKSMI